MGVKQPLGPEQVQWLDRIRDAGGEIHMTIIWQPVAHIKMDGGNNIRVPIRLFESLVDRGLFEEVEDALGHQSVYRLRGG